MLFRNTFGPSAIEDIVARAEAEDNKLPISVFLDELLDRQDIIAEVNSEEKRLLAFLCRPSVMEALVDMCVAENTTPSGDSDLDSKRKFKFPFVASEILASENGRISDAMVRSRGLAVKLFGFFELQNPETVDSLRASYVTKIISALLRCKNIEVLHHLVHNKSFIPSLLVHVAEESVADLVLRVLDSADTGRFFSSEVGQPRKESVDLLVSGNVLSELAKMFVKSAGSTEQGEGFRENTLINTSKLVLNLSLRVLQLKRVLMEIPSELNVFEKPEEVLGVMIDAGIKDYAAQGNGRSVALMASLDVAAELLTTEVNRVEHDASLGSSSINSVIAMVSRMSRQKIFGIEGNQSEANGELAVMKSRTALESTALFERCLRKRIDELVKILTEDRTQDSFSNSCDEVADPFGITKFRIAEFVLACTKNGNRETAAVLLEQKVPEVFLQIFFSREWNSIVLNTVTTTIRYSFEAGSTDARKAWLKAGIIPKIMRAWVESEEVSGQKKRPGHMGHVVLLCATLEKLFLELGEESESLVDNKERDRFLKFCEESVAKEIERQNFRYSGLNERESEGDTPPVNTF
ncbi:hypothetical protein NDN08_002805 [Rhodosorus marinus]|uniref:Uncharacterized protein n=1 Tax=Rhodosorus marinus TaxID=101924 RepID=A0AAV8UZ63_9RHOD|nr:hypothetical protein NDN08_002805 [Rhodosorus marinus]